MSLATVPCPCCGGQTCVPDDQSHAFCVRCGAKFMTGTALALSHGGWDGAASSGAAAGFVVEGGLLREYHAAGASVAVPDGVIGIGRGCFAGMCVTDVSLPEGVVEIQDGAFAGCRRLESVSFPSTLREVGNKAFEGCSSLRRVDLPEGVEELGQDAFANCTSLEHATVPVATVPKGCFCGCSSLAGVVLSEGLSSVGPAAFKWCSSLGKVSVPGGASVLSYRLESHPDVLHPTNDAFVGCSSLADVSCEGLTDEVVRRNFRGTPFAGRWKEIQQQVDEMRETAEGLREDSDGKGAVMTVVETIGTAIAGTGERS